MAKNNPFREKNKELKSKKGIKNMAWLSSALILFVTGLAVLFTKDLQVAFVGACVLCLELAVVSWVFYKNTKNRQTLILMILLLVAACFCLFEYIYATQLLG